MSPTESKKASEHSPLRVKINEHDELVRENGTPLFYHEPRTPIASCDCDISLTYATAFIDLDEGNYIAIAVNTHAQLVEALKAARSFAAEMLHNKPDLQPGILFETCNAALKAAGEE